MVGTCQITNGPLKRLSMKRFLLLTISILWMNGCIPLPLAAPPARLTASVGSHAESAPDRQELSGLGGHFDLRGALYPMHLWSDRLFDVGIGYAYSDDFLDQRKEHGPFVDIGIFFEQWGKTRPGATFQLRLLSTSDSNAYIQGVGAAFQLSLDLVDEVKGDGDGSCDSDGCIFGIGLGEGGVGIYAELAYEQLQSRSRVEASVGILIRTPAFFGVALIPIWNAL